MNTVIEHVRDSRTPLRADLSPADALVLSCLVYVDFHALPGPRSPHGCLLREVGQASSIPSLYRYSLASHADRPLLEAAGASARFGGLRVRDAVTRLTSSPLAQFGAVTFIDEAGATYVVLRGTDASAVGWAEDTRFGLDFPTDSQRWAANYLAYAASRAEGPLTVVGHSKGANLALYAAAATTPPELKRVYAFDPVGFPAPVVDGGFFESIDGLMHIYVTAGSWVSPLLPCPRRPPSLRRPGRGHSATTRMRGGVRGLRLLPIIVCRRGQVGFCVLFSAHCCGLARRGLASTSEPAPQVDTRAL